MRSGSSSMEPAIDVMLREMVETIVRAVNPERIVLFGSRAKGIAAADSDVDLLIVEDQPFGSARGRRREMANLGRLLARFPVAKDILVCSRDEVERWQGSLNHVIGRALREGRLLYARP